MLNRRLFFRALAGAPTLAVATPSEKPVRGIVTATYCECGMVMYCHGSTTDSKLGHFYTCVNPECLHYDKPVLMPLAVLPPADPRKVARIREQEREQRERQRIWEEQDRRHREALERYFEQERQVALKFHREAMSDLERELRQSGVAIRAKLQQGA